MTRKVSDIDYTFHELSTTLFSDINLGVSICVHFVVQIWACVLWKVKFFVLDAKTH